MKHKSPQSTYRDEKAKREGNQPHDKLMEDAKAAFDRMIDEGKAARKGGRPKRVPGKGKAGGGA